LSVLGAPVVIRDGVTKKGSDFLDLHTTKVTVLLVFFTPEIPAATVLSIEVELEDVMPDMSWSMEHLVITSRGDLERARNAFIMLYVCIAVMVVVTIIIAVYCAIHLFDDAVNDPKRHGLSRKMQLFTCTCDLCLLVVVVVIAGNRHKQIEDSDSDTDASIGSVSRLDWGSQVVSFNEKIDEFFSGLELVDQTISSKEWLQSSAMVVLIVLMTRLIFATSVHPRIGLLPSSLGHSFDDLIHFFMIFLLLFLLFAILAAWILGDSRPGFVNLTTACATQFNMMIGELPEGWSEDLNLLVYVVANFLVFFFFLLNFLLAIIVEGYMRTRKLIEDITYERFFFIDLWLSFYHPLLGSRLGWPSPPRVLVEMEQLLEKGKTSLTVADIRHLFPSENSAEQFMNAYLPFADKKETEDPAGTSD
jgi:hypothetical protein